MTRVVEVGEGGGDCEDGEDDEDDGDDDDENGGPDLADHNAPR